MLSDLILMLGFDEAEVDERLKEKLTLIIANTTARLKVLLGGIEPPDELDHIILEVAIIRFNRIGSEGMASHSVEGESLNFAASDDFSGYADEIQAFLEKQKETTRGKLRFI